MKKKKKRFVLFISCHEIHPFWIIKNMVGTFVVKVFLLFILNFLGTFLQNKKIIFKKRIFKKKLVYSIIYDVKIKIINYFII